MPASGTSQVSRTNAQPRLPGPNLCLHGTKLSAVAETVDYYPCEGYQRTAKVGIYTGETNITMRKT